jgi:hypothetical protein
MVLIGGTSGGSAERSWLVVCKSKGESAKVMNASSSAYRRKRMMVETQ